MIVSAMRIVDRTLSFLPVASPLGSDKLYFTHGCSGPGKAPEPSATNAIATIRAAGSTASVAP
jgi:hypothetical protein